VALGQNAAVGNYLSNYVIIATSNLKAFANRAAALAAITIPLGGVAGNTYLYFNSGTGAIEGVSL
jgi:hypothetical protein